ncbi:hypothetical protein [Ectothiorhodospira haloalkaliphila]|uniref:hypothetical protein n=1 Tax=Ectothiorhodospira haloalkaliphila TaxID=421628 RepID=UPI00046CFCC0|nr:hypothetical protein [Ectothiorhodospira haloalkaliphila]
MAATPEAWAHTSIRKRITPRFNLAQAVREQMGQGVHLHHVGAGLAREGSGRMGWPGRCWCNASPAGRLPLGAVEQADQLPPILQRLGITSDQWLEQSTRFEAVYRRQRRRSVA